MNSKSNHPEHVLKHIPVAVNNHFQKIIAIKAYLRK